MRVCIAFTFLILLVRCKTEALKPEIIAPLPKPNVKNYTYLALGDSYMASNPSGLRSGFPYKLTDTLKKEGLSISPTIIAQFGWTSSDLYHAILSRNINTQKYDAITLCIGVNNHYQMLDTGLYRHDFRKIINACLNSVNGEAKKIFVLSIPDWSVTQFAKTDNRTPEQIAREIIDFNAINADEATKAKVNYINITTISREAKTDIALISKDTLHPSEKMHNKWVRIVYPFIITAFN
ncbi:MAG: SGNH/GDSL hydrolase family protein [Sphingobacteriales bacterium]|nr:MAG: SGNH/GDSL hydrolase family protein [Sphingobacteriales bacterium]TAF80655.1 MAG: SGNH/GDSL hydrolase family protein [Sphingobacteriales bacterium]